MSSNVLNANKAISASFFLRLVNCRDYDAIPQVLTEDVEFLPSGAKGFAAASDWLRIFHDAFPDSSDVITGQWAEGDQVVTRIRFTGTQMGEWMGFAPTGEKVSWEGIAIHTIRDGRICRKETVIEQTHVFRQLGWLDPKNT